MARSWHHLRGLSVVFTLVFTLVFTQLVLCQDEDVAKYPLLMPNIHVRSDEAYMCHQFKMDTKQSSYIVGFEPNATMSRAHHVLIYGCRTPGSKHSVWNCGHEENEVGVHSAPVCDLDLQVVYAWARDAPQLDLPEGVGFEVGGDSLIQYLVLQVHYAHKLPDNVKDSSGVVLRYTSQKVPKLAGVLMVNGQDVVEPHKMSHWEAACPINEDKKMHPFAYRVHTHGLGVSVSGYRVRRARDGIDAWTLLGRRDPQLPEMFVPVEDFGTIENGDQVTASCTMNNFRDHAVWYGLTNKDEMCIFYLMYWVEGGSPLLKTFCNEGDVSPSWAKTHGLNNIPPHDADERRRLNRDPR